MLSPSLHNIGVVAYYHSIVQNKSPFDYEIRSGIHATTHMPARTNRPNVICVSSSVFIDYDMLAVLKLITILILILG